jgi:hypothetical protein
VFLTKISRDFLRPKQHSYALMTQMILSELRLTIGCELLMTEAASLEQVASRAARARGLVYFAGKDMPDEEESIITGSDKLLSLIAVSPTEVDKTSYPNVFPKVLGRVDAVDYQDGWMINTFYSDDPQTAVFLMAASLHLLKRVYADFSVSPAARALIERYYNSYKDDPMRVQLKFSKRSRGRMEPDYLTAAYLGPLPNFNAAFDAALEVGDKLIKKLGIDRDDAVDKLSKIGDVGFSKAYQDPMRTKKGEDLEAYNEMMREFERYLKESEPFLLADSMGTTLFGEEGEAYPPDWGKKAVAKFIDKFRSGIDQLISSAGDQGTKNRWDHISDWFEKSGGDWV